MLAFVKRIIGNAYSDPLRSKGKNSIFPVFTYIRTQAFPVQASYIYVRFAHMVCFSWRTYEIFALTGKAIDILEKLYPYKNILATYLDAVDTCSTI